MTDPAVLLTVGTALVVGFVAALVPVVTAEVYLAAVVSVVTGPVGIACAAALAVGQTVGKCLLFAGARRGRDWALHRADAGDGEADDGRPRGRLARGRAALASGRTALVRRSATLLLADRAVRGAGAVLRRHAAGPWSRFTAWCSRGLGLLDRPWPAAGVLLASAAVGMPPLAATSVAAGARRTGPALFAGCTLVGRFVRFGLIAWGGASVGGFVTAFGG